MQLLKNLLISLLFWQFMSAAAAQDLLPEEQAFEFVAEQQPDGSVKAAWIIADDYYMYREKMRFFLAGNRSTALDVAFPEGKEKDDALFGKVEVYTTNFAVTLPADQLNAGKFTLIAEGQGCNCLLYTSPSPRDA